ncbi:MAG: NAD(+) synthase [Elusimicrobiaceae bacterium]|nr:NAD(+) synthase [Elusimicrobiaceae bacterium]
MQLGFIKVAAAVPQVRVGDCQYNLQQTLSLLHRAAKEGAELVVFPELGLTGYTCADLFHQSLLLDQAEHSLQQLLQQTSHLPLISAVGMPLRIGNALYNVAVVFQKGKILGVVPKSFLPNYAEFYEKRWFDSGAETEVSEIELAGQTVAFGTNLLFQYGPAVLGVELCEDLWVPIPPSSKAALAGANIILNLSASNELTGKHTYLEQLILQQSARCCCGYVYASAGIGESSTDLVFTGNGLIAENGAWLTRTARFVPSEQLVITEMDVEKLQAERRFRTSFAQEKTNPFRIIQAIAPARTKLQLTRSVAEHPFVPADGVKLAPRCEEIIQIQTHGLMQRLRHTHCQRVVLGISGGLDSTLALLVSVRAFDQLGLPRKGIIGVTMPCFGTTDRTYSNAISLMKALQITRKEINIRAAVTQHLKDLQHPLSSRDVTYENAQARERTQVLMDVANQQQALVIGTGDLSELALGWATYNGDHMSMYGVNAGVPKTLVRYLVHYSADSTNIASLKKTLTDILDTPVSPELLPPSGKNISQKTEDLVGPYELHDFFLYYFLRFGFSPAKIAFLAQYAFGKKYKKAIIKKWLLVFIKRFFSQQFKRSCLPDGPKVGSVSLSPRGDWRMPSDMSAALWTKEVEKL